MIGRKKSGLFEEERNTWRGFQDESWKNAMYNDSLLKQKSRSKWFKKGDSNS